MLRAFIKFLITLGVIAGLGYGAFWFVTHTIETHSSVPIDRDANPEDYIVFQIESGMVARNVIEQLYDEGLIRHVFIAENLVRFNRWGAIQIGEYRVHGGLSLEEMFEMFRTGDVIEQGFVHITIPEGSLLTRIAQITADALGQDEDELLSLWSNPTFLATLIEEYWFLTDAILNPDLLFPLEGYIYPIRHDIPDDVTDLEEITRLMLDLTARQLLPIQNEMENSDMTVHQILAFASVIEGETQRVDQMADVAGVFANRLSRGEVWQTDVSQQYLAEERQEMVTYDMLTVDSPFNTYIHPGIPIGPMNAPSIGAMQAAMNPSQHNYLFFITDMFGCAGDAGEKLFAETYWEHLNNRNTYLNPAHENNGQCL